MELHGGNIHKNFGENREIIDYSANINPLGVPENLKKHIKKNIENLAFYPDPNYVELRKSISKHIKVPKKNIVVGNGATEIIFLFIRALKPKKTLIISPTFAEYERALKEVSSDIEYFELCQNENSFFIDVQSLKKELEKSYDLVVFCNPNNPTGNFITKDEFLEFFNEKPENTKFLVDEAFIDFIKNGEKRSFKSFKDKDIFIVRAFTKFFAIPGLRLGYGISFDEKILDKVYEIKEPWSLNSFSATAGKVLLEDKKYIEKTYSWLKAEKNYMYKSLKKIDKIKVYRSSANFFIIKLRSARGNFLYEKLLNQGFMIRRCENFRFLDDSYIRLAIKDRENNKKLIKALKKILD